MHFLLYSSAMDTYNKHYDINFEEDVKRGMVGENAHRAFLSGTHEVKTDYKSAKYGNFYIETTQYNLNGEWPSGINVTTANHWVFASPFGHGGITVPTELVKTIIAKENLEQTRQPVHNEHTNASTGLKLPVATLLRYMGYGDYLHTKQ